MKKTMLLVLAAIAAGVCIAATGDCYRRAETLSAGQSRRIALVNEYVPELGEYYDSGCYYLKIVCQKGMSYTVYTSSDSDEVWMSVEDSSWYSGTDDNDQRTPLFECGTDKYSDVQRGILRSEDWEEDSPSKVTYCVRLEGEIGTKATVTFAEGVVTETFPVGAEEKPVKIAMSSMQRSHAFIQLNVGETWFATMPLSSNNKYVIETTTGTDAFPASIFIDLSGFDGVANQIQTSAGNDRYEVYPNGRGALSFSVVSDPLRSTGIRYWQASSRSPEQHRHGSIRQRESVSFVPGKVNADGSDYFDAVIDETLFDFTADAGVCYKIGTSHAATNLLMNLYDATGNVLLRRTSAGGANGFDVSAAFSFPVEGVYYVGIAENLPDERVCAPSGNPATLEFADIDGSAECENAILFRAISFNAMEGSCAETVRLIADGYAIGRLPTPTRPRYEFLGWFSDAVGGEPINVDAVVSANMTCYARWRAVRKICFNENWALLQIVENQFSWVAATRPNTALAL